MYRKLANVVFEEFNKNPSISASNLLESIGDEDLEAYVREIVFEKHSISGNWEESHPGITPEMILQKYVKDTVLRFKLFKIDEQIKENHRKIESSETENDALQLMMSNNELEKDKKLVRESFSEIEFS